MKSQRLKAIVDFIYETGILAKTPRSGLWFLGTGNQSVAEHTLRTAFIGYALGFLTPKADQNKVMLMCLFHDLGEARTSDLNYVHQRYGRLAETQAIEDISKSVPFGKEIQQLFKEFEVKETLEAKLAKDADHLEWIGTLREEEVKGNTKTKAWITIALKRLKTAIGKKVGRTLASTHPDDWWFGGLSKTDPWFVERREQDRKWKRR